MSYSWTAEVLSVRLASSYVRSERLALVSAVDHSDIGAHSCFTVYRVGLPAVKAKLRERLTLAHFVVVRRVTGHSCSAGDGACHDVLGFLTLHRVRPQ